MSISLILKYAKLKSQLSASELGFADLLVGATESDKQALMDMWGVKAKASKPVTRRVIEKCATEGCGLTRRARIHKDANVEGYHLFGDPHGAARIKAGNRRRGMPSSSAIIKGIPRCVACYEIESHSNHDLDNGGHEFTTDLAGRVNAVLDGATKPDPDDEERCTATREGGRTCNLLLDHNVHQMKTAMGYHEFVASETAVGVGG